VAQQRPEREDEADVKRRMNLVFQGGGVRAIAHVGALAELERTGRVEVVKVGGTSAGAIVAGLYAAGYTPEEIQQLIPDLLAVSLKRVRMLRKAWRIYRSYGIYPTRDLHDRIRRLLEDKGKTRFSDLDLPCRVVAADVTNRKSEVFGENDDVDIAEAICMSISIPMFFRPYVYGRRYFVDGGLVSNFPLWVFGDDDLATIGFRLESRFERIGDITNVSRFAGAVIATACEAGDRSERAFPRSFTTVPIDTADIKATDFELEPNDVELLYLKGKDAARDIDWNKIPVIEKPEFSDPKADLVLDKTVRQLGQALTRLRQSPEKRFKTYTVHYRALPDGTAEITRTFEIMACGDHPLSCLVLKETYRNLPDDLSFDDLKVKAVDMVGVGRDVGVVPARNTAHEKWIGLLFLPAILPGDSRKVQVTHTQPGAFRRLVGYEEDEIGLKLNSSEPIDECRLILELDSALGRVEFGEPIGQSANVVTKLPERYTESSVVHEWVFPYGIETVRLEVKIRRIEARAAS
jgi:NTE family protein